MRKLVRPGFMQRHDMGGGCRGIDYIIAVAGMYGVKVQAFFRLQSVSSARLPTVCCVLEVTHLADAAQSMARSAGHRGASQQLAGA